MLQTISAMLQTISAMLQYGITANSYLLSNLPSSEGCPEGGVGQIYDHEYFIYHG